MSDLSRTFMEIDLHVLRWHRMRINETGCFGLNRFTISTECRNQAIGN